MDRDDLGNYRPVSNLPYLSKLLERAVADQLQTHLGQNNLHVKFQSAYRQGHSTETALLRVLNDLRSIVDKGNNALLVLLDLSAAFDTIDHSLLLDRLKSEVLLDNTVLEWFKSYLSDRSQQVLVGHAFSNDTPLLCGVPQGSVLGPLLFSLYTRQLSSLIQTFAVDHHLFADDSELYKCLPTDHDAALRAIATLESCCNEIKAWMNTNKLKLNEHKTDVLLCGTKNNRATVPADSIKIGEAEIPFSDRVKTLGVYLDSNLSLEDQVSETVKTCFFLIRNLSKARTFLTTKAAHTIAVSLILSRLDYCNSLLAGLPKSQLKRLQSAQNVAARIVTKTKKSEHITPVLKHLHWLPVHHRIHHKLLSITHRAVKENTPQYLAELIPRYSNLPKLRSSSTSLLERPKTKDIKTVTYGERTFKNLATLNYNLLPENIRNIDSVPGFRSALKTHLFREWA